MAFLRSLDISGSALTAQKLRMNLASENLANADSTVTATGEAYRKKSAVLSEKTNPNGFSADFENALNGYGGVQVSEIVEDTGAYTLEYDPGNPLANAQGYIERPSINTVEEMVEMIAASRSYEANVTVFNAVKNMATKALDIGK